MIKRSILTGHFLSMLFFLLILLVFFRGVIFGEGLIEFGDLTVPYSLQNYVNFYYPLWNPFGSWSTFEYIYRLLTYGPFLLIATLIQLDVGILERFFILFPLFLSFISMYVASVFIIRKIFKLKEGYIPVIAFLSSFVYALNPWVVSETRHFSMIWGYSFLPLILIMFIKILESPLTFKRIFGLALLLSFASVTPHWIVFNIFILFSYFSYGFILLCFKKEWSKISKNILKCLALSALYVLINSYWITPWFLSSLYNKSMMAPSYVLTNEVLDMLSRNSDLVNVIRIISGWWPQVEWSSTSFTGLWIVSSFVIPLFALLGNILNRRKKLVGYFSLMLVLVLFLATGTKGTYLKLYQWIVFSAPLLNKIGWVFRIPENWLSLVAFFYSFLILLALSWIFQSELFLKRKQINLIKVPIIIAFTFFIFFYSCPTVNGYATKILNPIKIPAEYYDVNGFLQNEKGVFKVAWLPPEGNKKIWGEGHLIGYFEVFSSSRPTMGSLNPDTKYYRNYVYYKLLSERKSRDIAKYFNFLNTRYILFHDDIIGSTEEETQDVIFNLNKQRNLKSVGQGGFISIFEVSKYANQVNIPSQNLVVLGGLDKFTSLNAVNSFDPINNCLFFPEQKNIEDKYNYISTADTLLMNSSLLDLSLSLLDVGYIIKPFDATDHYNPSKMWSKAGTNDPLHGGWHFYLEGLNIENWQFDYGKGLVFTEAKDSLEIPFNIKNNDKYKLFIRYFKNQRGGDLIVYLDGKPVQLKTTNQLNEFTWRDLGEYDLEKGEYQIVLQNISGLNAVNLFLLVPTEEYKKVEDNIKNLFKDKRVIYVFEGESNLYHQNGRVSNKYGSVASNGEVLEVSPEGYAWQDFEIPKEGSYKIGLEVRGKFNLLLDNLTIPVNSEDLSFIYTKTFYLEEGKHRIKLIPQPLAEPIVWNFDTESDKEEWEEFNLENKFGSEYKILWDKDEKVLKAELYSSSRGWKTVSSPLIPSKFGQKYYFKFSIKTDSRYETNFEIKEFDKNKEILETTKIGKIEEQTLKDFKSVCYEYEPKNTDVAYLQLQICHWNETENSSPGIIWLDDVEIFSYIADLDRVLIYSTKNDETLENIFQVKEKPAEITNYTEKNPTFWEVNVDASKPFILSFAESYDPLWEARVYKDGKLVKNIEAIPLYSIINGFWVDETGNLKIKIIYKPQDWFRAGFIVSFISLLCSLVFILLSSFRFLTQTRHGISIFLKNRFRSMRRKKW